MSRMKKRTNVSLVSSSLSCEAKYPACLEWLGVFQRSRKWGRGPPKCSETTSNLKIIVFSLCWEQRNGGHNGFASHCVSIGRNYAQNGVQCMYSIQGENCTGDIRHVQGWWHWLSFYQASVRLKMEHNRIKSREIRQDFKGDYEVIEYFKHISVSILIVTVWFSFIVWPHSVSLCSSG